MLLEIDKKEIIDLSCSTGESSRGLLDFSTLPKLNLIILGLFFSFDYCSKETKI